MGRSKKTERVAPLLFPKAVGLWYYCLHVFIHHSQAAHFYACLGALCLSKVVQERIEGLLALHPTVSEP
eukprot:4647485-Ditylum_brightwellii.AAC.1